MTDSPQAERRGRHREWVGQFEGQMLVCGLLAKTLYAAPDIPWLNSLIEARLFATLPFGMDVAESAASLEQLQQWTDRHRGGLTDAAADEIANDYMRLFVGPGRLPAAPWESVYSSKERAVFQRESVSVRNWYSRFELALETPYNEPADHVGLQFAFLAHLARLTVEAAEIRDGVEVKRLLAAQRGFATQHMSRWIPRWADDVVTHAATDFYRGIALLARGSIIEIESFFSVPPPDAQNTGPFRIVRR